MLEAVIGSMLKARSALQAEFARLHRTMLGLVRADGGPTVGFLMRKLDGYRSLHPEDLGHTFPTWDPHVRLDYIFTPERYMERIQMCTVVTAPPDAASASDHYPLFAEVNPG